MDKAAYQERLLKRAESNRKIFDGKYGKEVKKLLGLSIEEVNKITPGTTDIETYNLLIDIIKEASASNIEQAELKKRIEELGAVAVSIAKQIPELVDILV